MRIAILDDYQGVALQMANWAPIEEQADVVVFRDTITDPELLVARLKPFDIICLMRERTPLPRGVLERLPMLKLIASTGPYNASIDLVFADEQGIEVVHTGYVSDPTVELTWALILAQSRRVVDEAVSLRTGGWQQHVGEGLAGRTLGLLGLGRIGGRVATIGAAFGMKVVAWSQNLTGETAASVGAELVSQEGLFARADVLSIHLVLSHRSALIVNAHRLGLMKASAILVNTSRAGLVDTPALVAALQADKLAGAALDVFDEEPLSDASPMRRLNGVLATPHIGYVSRSQYQTFYGDTVDNISRWLSRATER